MGCGCEGAKSAIPTFLHFVSFKSMHFTMFCWVFLGCVVCAHLVSNTGLTSPAHAAWCPLAQPHNFTSGVLNYTRYSTTRCREEEHKTVGAQDEDFITPRSMLRCPHTRPILLRAPLLHARLPRLPLLRLRRVLQLRATPALHRQRNRHRRDQIPRMRVGLLSRF